MRPELRDMMIALYALYVTKPDFKKSVDPKIRKRLRFLIQ